MESAAKSTSTAKSSTEMLEFANNATMVTMSMPMEHVKPGPTLIQHTTDALNGKIINVKHVPPNTTSMPIKSV